MSTKTKVAPRTYKSLTILLISVCYLLGALVCIPFTLGAFSSYYHGVPGSNDFVQLGVTLLVLVLIPVILAYGLWQGYRFAWWLGIAFSAFNIVLYVITFSVLNISLSTGVVISNSIIGPLGYAIAYGLIYIGTYLLVIIEILLDISLIYFLTRSRVKTYFGL